MPEVHTPPSSPRLAHPSAPPPLERAKKGTREEKRRYDSVEDVYLTGYPGEESYPIPSALTRQVSSTFGVLGIAKDDIFVLPQNEHEARAFVRKVRMRAFEMFEEQFHDWEKPAKNTHARNLYDWLDASDRRLGLDAIELFLRVE